MSTENMHETQKKLEAFGAGLKILRKSKKFNQADLASKFNLDASSISRIENATAVPNFDTALKLASTFGLTPEQVISIGAGEGAETPVPTMVLPSWLEDILPTLRELTPKERDMLKAFIEAMKR